MTVSSEAVEPLVEALAEHASIKESGVIFAPASEARFHEPGPGTLTWDWCGRSAAEQGIQTLAYYDADGQIVSVGMAAAGSQVTEIELWRGDGQPVLSVPRRGDLWEMEPGRIYSPRA
jgi:hypothetical protein